MDALQGVLGARVRNGSRPGGRNIRVRDARLVPRHTTIAVAEWESEQLGRAGAERYRAWMRGAGIMERFTLETYDGEIVVAS